MSRDETGNRPRSKLATRADQRLARSATAANHTNAIIDRATTHARTRCDAGRPDFRFAYRSRNTCLDRNCYLATHLLDPPPGDLPPARARTRDLGAQPAT